MQKIETLRLILRNFTERDAQRSVGIFGTSESELLS